MSEKKESAAKAEESQKAPVKTHYDKKMEQRARDKKREKREQRAWKIAGILILTAIIAFILSFPIRKYLAIHETVCTIGGRNVSRVEFDYNYNMVKNAYMNSYGQYLSYYGLDSEHIEDEMYDGSLTFRDYFEKEAVERIKGNTRRYARKQLTWYKKDPQIRWFHPDDKEQIISYISQDYEQRNN